MERRLLFIDVGTHMGQEYLALFGHGPLTLVRHWLRHRRRARRAGRPALGPAAFAAFRADLAALRARRSEVAYVMVEPNARLFALPVYRQADVALNLALAGEPDVAALRPLYLAGGNPTGQGSSLFEAKPNVTLTDFDLVATLDARRFADSLEAAGPLLGTASARVVLRINNEGAEVEVIEALHAVFGPRLVAVMGSLNDVAKVKGDAALHRLHGFLGDRGIPFLPLQEDFATWPAAAAFLRKILG